MYREELQGLIRDVERAQLMGKEMKLKQRTSKDEHVSALFASNDDL